MGATYVETGLDLSERQLAYFAFDYLHEEGNSQNGEGTHMSAEMAAGNPNYRFDVGGAVVMAAALFSTGTGPYYESEIPYKNDEGAIYCQVKLKDSDEALARFLTEDAIEALEANGATITKRYYAKEVDIVDTKTAEIIKTETATWDVDEDYQSTYSYEISDSNVLPEFRVLDKDGKYVSTSQEAIAATKSEIYAGRAVSIGYASDMSRPGQARDNDYINTTTWAHYTYKDAPASHAVTIVGWDDNYSKTNFGTDESDESKQPPADGAWIVKNSWGSSSEGSEFPNYNDWGVRDDDGNGTGYFYLSYYDKSIQTPESFDFDLEASETEESLFFQYNYMVGSSTFDVASDAENYSANVYTTPSDCKITTVTCWAAKPNTDVTYEIYALSDTTTNPKDGELLATITDHFAYSGYHSTKLDENNYVHLNKGQKYSAVVMQKCLDNNKYYETCLMRPSGVYTDEQKTKLLEAKRTSLKTGYFNDKYNEAYAQYIAAGKTEAEAKELAAADANAYVESDEVTAKISTALETYEKELGAFITKGIVNEGESYSYALNDQTGEYELEDWKDVIEQVKALNPSIAIDNFPIKVSAEYDECEHELVAHERKEPTSTEDGYEAYWECSKCGRLFSDAEATIEIEEPVVIPATGSNDDGNSSNSSKDSRKALPQTGDSSPVVDMCVLGATGLALVGVARVCKRRSHNA